ncbi:MAG: polyisoprenoid-binding protein [Candidatus Latescibacteria bacterium]|nr:polyisoprenoid-binding protein [Candidatus Latescibacterota bacterium]
MKKSLFLAVILTLTTAVQAARAETYEIDVAHSSATFSIRHIFSQVKGRFTQMSGSITYDPKEPEKASVVAKIASASINTDNEKRDAHLKNADFFDVEKYPDITFQSKGAKKEGDRLKVTGTLNMHGVEKEVTLDVEVLGVGPGPRGRAVAGFEATTTINRKDFGINWNRALDQGGVMLGEDVKVTLSIEAGTKPKEAGK